MWVIPGLLLLDDIIQGENAGLSSCCIVVCWFLIWVVSVGLLVSDFGGGFVCFDVWIVDCFLAVDFVSLS